MERSKLFLRTGWGVVSSCIVHLWRMWESRGLISKVLSLSSAWVMEESLVSWSCADPVSYCSMVSWICALGHAGDITRCHVNWSSSSSAEQRFWPFPVASESVLFCPLVKTQRTGELTMKAKDLSVSLWFWNGWEPTTSSVCRHYLALEMIFLCLSK